MADPDVRLNDSGLEGPRRRAAGNRARHGGRLRIPLLIPILALGLAGALRAQGGEDFVPLFDGTLS